MDFHQDRWDAARKLLGVADDATNERLRQAYIEQVRKHPPDRSPEQFERIRDAYDLLKDPLLRVRCVLVTPDPSAPLTELFGSGPSKRQFVGPELWLNVLKEKRA
jgi:DnaJ-domain-containing protein 1